MIVFQERHVEWKNESKIWKKGSFKKLKSSNIFLKKNKKRPKKIEKKQKVEKPVFLI